MSHVESLDESIGICCQFKLFTSEPIRNQLMSWNLVPGKKAAKGLQARDKCAPSFLDTWSHEAHHTSERNYDDPVLRGTLDLVAPGISSDCGDGSRAGAGHGSDRGHRA